MMRSDTPGLLFVDTAPPAQTAVCHSTSKESSFWGLGLLTSELG